jgi:hypothetical protein
LGSFMKLITKIEASKAWDSPDFRHGVINLSAIILSTMVILTLSSYPSGGVNSVIMMMFFIWPIALLVLLAGILLLYGVNQGGWQEKVGPSQKWKIWTLIVSVIVIILLLIAIIGIVINSIFIIT